MYFLTHMTGCWIRLAGSHRFVTQFSNLYYASNDDQPLSISPMIVVPPDRISSRPSELVTGRTWLDVFAYLNDWLLDPPSRFTPFCNSIFEPQLRIE